VDPQRWDPLVMKFCEYFGAAENVYPSRLAHAPRDSHLRLVPAQSSPRSRSRISLANRGVIFAKFMRNSSIVIAGFR
jgi:hypothetical protein